MAAVRPPPPPGAFCVGLLRMSRLCALEHPVDDDDTTACAFAVAIIIGIFQMICVDIPMGIDGFPSPLFRG